jgi:tRNA uridine 5-carbamoylmethylation protein Kti12
VITVTISGPRAAGKSTLARHIAKTLEQEGHNVLLSHTVDRGTAPFEPMGMREVLIREEPRGVMYY